MARINPNFQHDIFTFLHKPLRVLDKKEGKDFLQRFLIGPQQVFEDTQGRIQLIKTLKDPAKIRADLLQYLKDHVGLTKELANITNDLSDNDLRKLIALAVPLWKQKGLEVGYKNILRLFTGKGSRVFNWFDFRWIIGEVAIGSELLGEDPFLISVPGVEGSLPTGNVVLLLSFEDNVRDRSIISNNAVDHANLNYFSSGAVTGSEKYANFDGGTTFLPLSPTPLPGDIISIPYHTAYDLSGDFTIELFVRTSFSQDAILFSWSDGNKEVSIRFKSSTNEVIYRLDDGTTVVTESLSAVTNIDDGIWHHIALIVNRTEDKARLYLVGTEATTGASLSGLGDVSSIDAPMFIGGSGFETELYRGDMDNLRLSLSDQYGLTNATIPVPGLSFVEYIEEQLDEFKTDIRVVDDGTLNRTLIKRIINLMRPISERVNVLFIKLFEDFQFGRGDFLNIQSPIATIFEDELIVQDGSIEHWDGSDNETFQDIHLQIRQKFTISGSFAIRFLVQDALNYYQVVIDENGDDSTTRLEKVVAGVPTVLDGPNTLPVFVDAFYLWTISTDFNNIEGKTLIGVFQDGNVLHQIEDSTFSVGTWGISSSSGGESRISDVEMFLKPLEIETVYPGFNL